MSTVLIVVDMQLDFYSRNSAVSQSFPSLASKIGQLVSLARETENVEVVHLREGSNDNVSPWYNFWSKLNPGKSSAADATTAATEPCAQDTDGEKVFVKYGYDGVGVDSGMVSYLEDKYSLEDKKPIILVCGLVTSCCVHLNAAGLFLRGFPTFVVADACGDRTEKMHLEHLKRESRRCFGVVNLEDVRDVYGGGGGGGKGGEEDSLISRCWENFTQKEK